MKKYFTLFIIVIIGYTGSAQTAKLISDCSVVYQISVQDANANPQLIKAMEGATKTVYLRGTKTRSDLTTSGFLQTTLQDSKSDTTIILRELGNNKYISYLSDKKKKEQYKKFDGIQFSNTTEKKTILGYQCIKTVAKLIDGSSFNIYYTDAIVPSNKQFEYQFKDLPGFVLEYEALSEDNKYKVKYTASKISLIPIPIAKFDIPTSGYRVL